MLLFRSEEHVRRWCTAEGRPAGPVVSLEQTWALARAWHLDRRDPEWRRRTVEESEALFAAVGLSGQFWRLR
jgi:hypothetical protein